MREERNQRMLRYQNLFEQTIKEPLDTPPLPLTARQTIHDGPGWQLFDANERPVLTDLLRDTEDAAWLLRFINDLEDQRKEAIRRNVDESSNEYKAMRNLVLAARELLRKSLLVDNIEVEKFSEALKVFESYWTE